jgi:hypothetical protein
MHWGRYVWEELAARPKQWKATQVLSRWLSLIVANQ